MKSPIITRSDANKILKMMGEFTASFGIKRVEIIGSIASLGKSMNDIDFKITCEKDQVGKEIYEPEHENNHIDKEGNWNDEIKIDKCDSQAILMALTSGFDFGEDEEFNYLYEGSSPVFHYNLDGKDVKIDFVAIETESDSRSACKN